MHFPVEDVVTNFHHFITSVKRATGNAKDPDAADRKLNSSGARPGLHRPRPFEDTELMLSLQSPPSRRLC